MFRKISGVPNFDSSVLTEKLRAFTRVELDMENCIHRIESVHSLDDCPTCLQNVSDEHKEGIRATLMEQHDSFLESKKILADIVATLKTEQAEFERLSLVERKYHDEVSKLTDSIISYGKDIEAHQATINRISGNRGNIEDEQKKLAELAQNALAIVRRRTELVQERELQDISSLLLKDSGIKAAIIKEYVPILNKLINRYLGLFGFDVNFRLDENFNETVHSRGRDEFTYNNFSEGEKRKIDIAILLAFRKVTALKNSATCNLLLMDEIVDSSLDPTSREVFLDILNAEGGNNFVISHTTPSTDMFDAVIEVKKQGDFSTYEFLV